MSVEFSDLACESCEQVTEHELHYAGRLLESTRCTHCGHRVVVSHQALLPAYLHDLEQRVTSKPQRMLRRATHDPVRFVAGLPLAVLRQPPKFARELWSLVRR
jgi:DNA-directed RNA polymerase subunit RPC12/RpoP